MKRSSGDSVCWVAGAVVSRPPDMFCLLRVEVEICFPNDGDVAVTGVRVRERGGGWNKEGNDGKREEERGDRYSLK